MKRTLPLFLILSVLVGLLLGCVGPMAELPIVELPNEPPIIGFWALQSPNGIQQHAPYEWDISGYGFDPDGEIVLWIIRIDGDTYRVGNHSDRWRHSEIIRYQFRQAGWYAVTVTAFDNDGASTTYRPDGGLWYVGR